MNREDIFATAVKKWGVDSQVFMAVEEMAELTKALVKMRRQDYQWGNPLLEPARENLKEEVADVELMLEQIKYMFEIHDISDIKEKKLLRLERLLEGLEGWIKEV